MKNAQDRKTSLDIAALTADDKKDNNDDIVPVRVMTCMAHGVVVAVVDGRVADVLCEPAERQQQYPQLPGQVVHPGRLRLGH